ncbi:hypothetical protein D3C78_937600 [compost metagenome]
MTIQLEVAETGMEGQVPGRHWQGNQRYAGQLQADQLAQGFGGADLDLPGQLLAQGFQR